MFIKNLQNTNGANSRTSFHQTVTNYSGLPLMKNVIKTLANDVLIPLGLTAAASAADAAIHKKS